MSVSGRQMSSGYGTVVRVQGPPRRPTLTLPPINRQYNTIQYNTISLASQYKLTSCTNGQYGHGRLRLVGSVVGYGSMVRSVVYDNYGTGSVQVRLRSVGRYGYGRSVTQSVGVFRSVTVSQVKRARRARGRVGRQDRMMGQGQAHVSVGSASG